MSQFNIENLNRKFGITNHLTFLDNFGELTIAQIQNEFAQAKISVNGGQILHFQPTNEEKILWLSPQSDLKPGLPIRGGIPVCWPWFGPHAERTDFPLHGFARLLPWEVVSSNQNDKGEIQLVLNLQQNDGTLKFWPYQFRLVLAVTIGKQLTVELTTYNNDNKAFVISEALHSYFFVQQVDKIMIDGLDQITYWDKVDATTKVQIGPVKIAEETDHVYFNTPASCVITLPESRRRIQVDKDGSHTTVIWNPWREKAAQIPDIGESVYQEMVCVETANAFQNQIQIAPGESHRMKTVIRLINQTNRKL
ncbi:D-hexose-6-phosphate mutarotase [candidate division KSB1 bacterium]|nr:D-hexose-6-phosphate mutarotase [candidate division KSB1 bacterium]